MTKTKSTKRALLLSALSMFICISMLIGTTFAWFTDSVTSAGNKIVSGSLKLDLELLTKNDDGTFAWNSIKESKAPIFTYDKWEPGYTDVKILKVENEGNLALKWVAKFVSSTELSILANVIDVFVKPSATELKYPADRNLEGYKKVGTVADFVNTIDQTTYGSLKEDEVAYLGIALKMQESAGNEYQDLSLGAFDIMILATQDTVENDSFDNMYDKDAPKLFAVNGVKYDTAEAALDAAEDGDKVQLSSLTAPITIDKEIELTISNTNIVAEEGINAITVNANATIIADSYNSVVGGKGADGIKVASGATLSISGKGVLIAKGNGGSETQAEYNAGKGGSGIDVEGNIVIDGLNTLIAEGYGKHAFGIGGATKSIVINNSTVKYAKGGMVNSKITSGYGKSDNESGAAIGSYTDGAVISITNSTVTKAEGGSKAAGIGAMYHTGVTVKISNSNVTAYGGSSSAGIGGSRVQYENDKITPEQTVAEAVTVEIVNSKVMAVGGDFGAGIGSGYDTYCKRIDKAPVNTVKIDAASDITAQGGWLGAGIGTGHNVINFVGDINCDTSKVFAGNSEDPNGDPFKCCYGMPTTMAENVGLGVYNIKNCTGKEVTKVSTADELVAAFANLKAGDIIYLANDIDMTGKTIAAVTGNKGFTMLGNGHTIKNLNSTQQALFVAHSGSSSYTFEGVVLEKCAVDSTTNYGALFVGDGDTSDAITIKNCVVKNCTVKSAKYAAAFIGYTAGYNVANNGPVYSDILIENCSVIGGSITGGGSVGAAIAHAGGNVDTTNTITGLKVDGVAIIGEDAAHTGIVVGTANVGKTIINGTTHTGVTGNYNTEHVLYGRAVLGTTGSLTID